MWTSGTTLLGTVIIWDFQMSLIMGILMFLPNIYIQNNLWLFPPLLMILGEL